jgi:EAL domain-containing protein (putative c-di-GMP-specific phosphodiesterase class I)/GGDEF domain-containing protein
MAQLRWHILLALVAMLGFAMAAAAQENPDAGRAFDEIIAEARTNMMRDPASALALAQEAEGMAPAGINGTADGFDLAMANWLQSEALTRLGRPNEARPVAEHALELLGENPAPTKLYADILLSLGRTLKLMGEHGEALDIFQSAFDVYVAIGETRSQAIVLQSIGSIYNDARQYTRAVQYYEDAIERHQDTNLDLAAFNNLGNAYTALEDYGDALSYYNRALEIAREMDSNLLQARILNNIASLHIAAGEWDAADEAIDDAFAAGGDPQGAEWARFLYGVRAQAAFGRREYQRARTFMALVFDGIELTETNHHFTDFHETAAHIFEAVGEYPLAIEHFEAFKRLDDESREFAASANAALTGAQFDFAAQELEIEQLRAEGLERDLALIQSETRQRTLLAIGAGFLLFVSLAIAVIVLLGFRARNRLMREQLNVDAETGLPTRHALVIERDRRLRDQSAGSYFAAIQLDRASSIETLLGIDAFTIMQKRLGARLADADGVVFSGLMGPGLFGAILDTDDEIVLQDEIRELLAGFCQPLNIDGVNVDINATIGLDDSHASDLAARHAIIAVSQAQEMMAQHAIFNDRQLGDPAENLSLMTRMCEIIRTGRMELHLQPKLDLRNGRYSSAEALCRWPDGEGGYISPDKFIPQAEETGRIRELTEWSLYAAKQHKIELASAGFDIDIAVNISGRLLTDAAFGHRALEILGFGVSGFTFEITETAMIHQPEAAIANLDRWVDAGIRIAIDDYGTGLSSLSYLKRLPCSELKLDKIFIEGARTNAKDRTLIKSTVDLAHNLGMTLTAEGVEDEMVLAALKAMGCDHAQGYGLARPLPARKLADFLKQNASEDTAKTPDTSGGSSNITRIGG